MVRAGRKAEVRGIQGLAGVFTGLARFFSRRKGEAEEGREDGTPGERGEEAAARWLKRRGYRIEARNYRCRAGELDIVASRKGLLVFVEVKARSRIDYGLPAEAVTREKKKRIVRAASAYLMRFKGRCPPARFDVVEIIGDNSGSRRVVHIPDAFRPGWEVS